MPIISDHVMRRTLEMACRLQSAENSQRMIAITTDFSSCEKHQHQSMILDCEGTLHQSLAKLQELLA
jgi:hypothetical protein